MAERSAMAGMTDCRKAAAIPSTTRTTTAMAIPRRICQRVSARTAGFRLTARNRAISDQISTPRAVYTASAAAAVARTPRLM